MPIPPDWREVSDAEVERALAEAQAAPMPEGCTERIIWLGGVVAFGHYGKCFIRPGEVLINVLNVKAKPIVQATSSGKEE